MTLLRCPGVAAILLLAAITPVAAQGPVGPHSRAEAVKIIADLRRIVSPDGLQATETAAIGGIDQVLSIRSQDLRNPVLIYFHGGPGFVEMPLDWWWGRGWDEYFTVIHWDQRNAGKTTPLAARTIRHC